MHKQAFDAIHHPEIQNIVISDIEYNGKITLRRNNPVYAIIGMSGMMMQQMAMEVKSARYTALTGDVASSCETFILKQLESNLTAQGYHVKTVTSGFWQTMKLTRTPALADTDAIMRVTIKRLGFRAESVAAPNQPSIMLSVTLIKPKSREVLYKKDFGIGYKASGYHLTRIDYDRSRYSYPSLSSLMQHALQSKQGLMIALSQTAGHISSDLKKQTPMLAGISKSKNPNRVQD